MVHHTQIPRYKENTFENYEQIEFRSVVIAHKYKTERCTR